MPRPLSAREKTIFVACLGVVTFYLAYHFGYQNLQDETSSQKEQILRSSKDLKTYTKIVRGEKTIEAKLKEYTNILKQKGSDEAEMTKVLSDIEAVAGKVNIKIINMEPEKIKKGDLSNYFSIDVQTEGPMKKICEFLYALESKPNRFRIDEIRIEKYAMRADSLKCQLVVSRFLIP
ncbi:MAG: GspMb/PilO family protein [Candidatus Omnitrophica bacterium]|nr:GspMb/PilO family protein [Candidatus Omnitrophota bacterium]